MFFSLLLVLFHRGGTLLLEDFCLLLNGIPYSIFFWIGIRCKTHFVWGANLDPCVLCSALLVFCCPYVHLKKTSHTLCDLSRRKLYIRFLRSQCDLSYGSSVCQTHGSL